MDWMSKLKAATPDTIPTIPAKPDPKNLSHYCQPGECWCSAKLPRTDYPESCRRYKCQYHQASQDAPQTTNGTQGELTPVS